MFNLSLYMSKIAIMTESENYTYADLMKISQKIANEIPSRSLVFHIATNTAASVAGFIAFINNKVVPAMIDADLNTESLQKLIKIYRPSYLWLPENQVNKYSGYIYKFSWDGYALMENENCEPFPLNDNLALLMTTSGSTGSPKFVRLSYDNILANTESIIEYLHIDEKERAVTNLPMHYVFGLSIINTHLISGASVVVTDKTLFQKEFWQLMREKEVTSLSGVPYTFEMLNRLRFFQMDLPKLKTITQAGGKLDPELHQKFAEYVKKSGKNFVVMYGAAEATARMGYLPPEKSLEKCGSMGVAIPGGSFELIDKDGKIIDNTDMVGELVYYGKNVMMGYAICGEDLNKDDELKGRLVTGDLAKRDSDGFYTIVGRKKRFLKMFGKRTNLEEVEHILRQHFVINDVACCGIDNKLYVFVTYENIVNEIAPYLSDKLSLHPLAFSVKYLPKLPKNSAGKILYKEFEQYYNNTKNSQ